MCNFARDSHFTTIAMGVQRRFWREKKRTNRISSLKSDRGLLVWATEIFFIQFRPQGILEFVCALDKYLFSIEHKIVYINLDKYLIVNKLLKITWIYVELSSFTRDSRITLQIFIENVLKRLNPKINNAHIDIHLQGVYIFLNGLSSVRLAVRVIFKCAV